MNSVASLVKVQYFAKGKLLWTIYSHGYPHYKAGETVELHLPPSPREKQRRPAKEWSSRFYKITKVHHIVEEQIGGNEHQSLGMEVFLEDPD